METSSCSDSDKEEKKSKNKVHRKRETREMFEITNDNGYVLCDKYFIPEEILALILSHVPSKELVFKCRRVCKWWCNVVDSHVWRLKLQRINVPINKIIEMPWFACYWIDTKRPLNRNLVKNNCGQEGLKHWQILSSGGDGWLIEKPPVGCEGFPFDDASSSQHREDFRKHNSCFTTSYISCTKTQTINLSKEGLCPEIMDTLQPTISITDWCCGRFDCTCIYELEVKLLDKKKKMLKNYAVRNQLGGQHGNEWIKISYVFNDYGPGVRFIEFYHGGMDSQFWKGHYGSKMTGATVTVSL